jgi:EKC/KEOPS complex subunit PCC1/LAGE3
MLRVAVNGFFESIGVVIGVMRGLDVDVMSRDMYNEDERSMAGTQGLEEIKS